MPSGRAKLPTFEVMTEREEVTETLQGHETEEGHMEYELSGDRTVIVQWDGTKSKSRSGKNGKNGNKNARKGSKK
jgi:hypothetical protein